MRTLLLATLPVVAAALAVVACSEGSPSAGASDAGAPRFGTTPLPDGEAPPKAVVLPQTMRETREAGLCMRWAAHPIDLSAFNPIRGNDYVRTYIAHGVSGGFSLAAARGGYGSSSFAVQAFDRTGASRAAALDLPADPGAVMSDVIATSDGGWIGGWSTTTSTYFLRYDADGVPRQRSTSQASVGGALLGISPAGGLDVAWRPASDGGAAWAMGTLSPDGATFSGATPFGNAYVEPSVWRRGDLLAKEDIPATTRHGSSTVILQSWTESAEQLLEVEADPALEVPTGNAAGAAFAPGDDPHTAIAARYDGVWFLAHDRALVVPSDVLLNDPSPWPAPSVGDAQRAVVGFTDWGQGDGGASQLAEIVDVSSTGARGAIGVATIDPWVAGSYYGTLDVRTIADAEEDAYLVLLAGGDRLGGAVFTCAERAS